MALRRGTALRIGIAVAAVAAVVVGTKLTLGWPLERAVYLAPVLVVCVSAVLGLLLLWGKVALQSLRESRRPRLVVSLWLAGFAVIALLTVLGVELPKE
jgi:predicted neutral ceramidase superfamily lipid hydrolase